MAKTKGSIGANQRKKRTMHPNSLANLKPPMKPGETLNPNGPPKRKLHLWTRLCKLMDGMTLEQFRSMRQQLKAGAGPDIDKMKLADITALRWAIDAAGGKWQQLRDIIERDEGKVPQGMNLSGDMGAVIQIRDSVMSDAEHRKRMDAQTVAVPEEPPAGDTV